MSFRILLRPILPAALAVKGPPAAPTILWIRRLPRLLVSCAATFGSLTRYLRPPPTNGGGGPAGVMEILLLLGALLSRSVRSAPSLACLLAVSSAIGVPAALAATGDLDPDFADHGRLTPIVGTGGGAVFVDSAASGGILIGGSDLDARGSLFNDGMGCTFRAQASSFVTRIDERGALDSTFTAVTLPDIEAVSMARQADGKIVGIGHKIGLLSSYRCSHTFTPTVFRFNSDGSLDTGFGLNGTRELRRLNTVRSLALDSKGRIIMAGTRVVDDDDPATPGWHELAVMRLRPDGKRDLSFGADGYFFGPKVDRTFSAYFRSRYDGMDKINLVRLGADSLRISVQSGGDCQVVGVRADGMRDSDFGTAGVAIPRTGAGARVTCHAMKSESDGRLVVAGNSGNRGFLGRLLENGEPDPAFNADHAVSRLMPLVTSVVITADGKLLAAGTGRRGTSLVRLQDSGELDVAFGDAGRTWLDLDSESGSPPTVHDMIVLADGTVIAAGSSGYSGTPYANAPFAVRLLGDDGGVSRGILGFSVWHAAPQESEGKAILRVRRSGGSDGIVSARFFTVAELDALEHEDFVPRSGVLRWEAGDRSVKSIVIELADGGTSPEYLESFRVVLDDARGGSGLGRRWATVDIQPDGSPGGQIEIYDDQPLDVREDGIVQVEVTRNLYFEGPVCATLTARSGSAIAGEDFHRNTTVVCWGDQEYEDSRLVGFKMIDDDVNEGAEKFTVRLSDPTGGAIIGPSGSARVTLYDND